MQDRGFNSFASNMIRLSVFGFGPEKLLGLSRNGPLGPEWIQILRHLDGAFDWLSVSSFVFFLANQNVTFFYSFLPKKTTFLLANHNRGIFSCILLDRESSRFDKLQIKV